MNGLVAGLGALVAAAAAVGTCAGVLWHGGRRDGRIDAILERLTKNDEDHEDRLRDLEHRTWARRSSR